MNDLNTMRKILQEWRIDQTWSLFLDRDGVINQRKIGSYIMVSDEFEFIPGVLQAFAAASRLFRRIVVVTNQQGIGKGLMSEDALAQIHDFMIEKVGQTGGRIDRIYHSPHLDTENHPNRKPNPGMAVQAARDFTDISFKRSIMLGDSVTDMQFARNLGMKCVFIGNPDELDLGAHLFDLAMPSFSDFMKELNVIYVNP